MEKNEMIKAIQAVLNIERPNEDVYYKLLRDLEAEKTNYYDYMTTEPMKCDIELERLPDADFDLCAALLTMVLREDQFMNGSLMRRYEKGQVDDILKRMIDTLDK